MVSWKHYIVWDSSNSKFDWMRIAHPALDWEVVFHTVTSLFALSDNFMDISFLVLPWMSRHPKYFAKGMSSGNLKTLATVCFCLCVALLEKTTADLWKLINWPNCLCNSPRITFNVRSNYQSVLQNSRLLSVKSSQGVLGAKEQILIPIPLIGQKACQCSLWSKTSM